MAPTNPKTRHKPEKTKVGEKILDLVTPYIHDVDDRNSVSLVSRNFFEIEGITRKRLTVHTLYCPNPASLSKRFPFIEALTLKGPPYDLKWDLIYTDDYDIQITPWIEQLALEFRCLKELHICGLLVEDEDLEILARTRGNDLRSLKIKKCQGYSSNGFMHVSKYCNQLRTLCLKYATNTDSDVEDDVEVKKDATWLHQLAMNSTVLERFHVPETEICYVEDHVEDLTLLAKNCSNSLISLKIGSCLLSKLGDAFKFAVRLEHFGGDLFNAKSTELVGFRFPPNIRSLRLNIDVTEYLGILPLLNQIRKLKLGYVGCQCLLFTSCPSLELLYTEDGCGDIGVQLISRFCKKLRKLAHYRCMTHVGLMALAKGCTKLECLEVKLEDTSNEALECLGTHLKNLRKFRMRLNKVYGTIDPPLDNGIRAMLMGCKNLESLDIRLWKGGLTDVALDYIGKYGANLKSLTLVGVGNFDAGFVKLSEGCPKLRKLRLIACPFSKEVVTNFVFNMPSLKYVHVGLESYCDTYLVLIRPEFQL